MKRKINTTMDDLMMAFDMNPDEHSQYINLETGGIAIISEFSDSFDEEGNAIYEEEDKQRSRACVPGCGMPWTGEDPLEGLKTY